MPAQQAFLPRTLEVERLPSANALLQGTYQLASIVGPPIAGAVIAVSDDGRGVRRRRDVVRPGGDRDRDDRPAGRPRRAAMADPRRRNGPGQAPAEVHEPFLAAIRGGIRYVLGDRALVVTMVISLVLNFALNGPVMVGMPWLADQRFAAGPAGLGLLAAAWAAGALVGVVVAGSTSLERPGPDPAPRRRGLRRQRGSGGRAAVAPSGSGCARADGRRDRLREHRRDLVDPAPRRPRDDRAGHEPRDADGRRDHAAVARACRASWSTSTRPRCSSAQAF